MLVYQRVQLHRLRLLSPNCPASQRRRSRTAIAVWAEPQMGGGYLLSPAAHVAVVGEPGVGKGGGRWVFGFLPPLPCSHTLF